MVRALASRQCGPGSIPGPAGVICGLSLLLVLQSLLREVFLWTGGQVGGTVALYSLFVQFPVHWLIE